MSCIVQHRDDTDHSYAHRKSRVHLQTTRKLGCKAAMTVKEVIMFPSFTVR